MPSEKYPVIQDSYYYQWFSYVISSPLQQVEYETFIQDIIHPAGFIQFADVTINDSSGSPFSVREPIIGPEASVAGEAFVGVGRAIALRLEVEQSKARIRKEELPLPITLEHS